MKKNTKIIISVAFSLIFFLVATYSFLGYAMVSSFAATPNYPAEKAVSGLIFWTISLFISVIGMVASIIRSVIIYKKDRPNMALEKSTGKR